MAWQRAPAWQRTPWGSRAYRDGEVEAEVWLGSDRKARWEVRGHTSAFGEAADLEQAQAVAGELAEALRAALDAWKAEARARHWKATGREA